MDVKGAVELARLLRERHGDAIDEESGTPAAAEGASPIYRWIRTNPPLAPQERHDDSRRSPWAWLTTAATRSKA